MKFKEGDHIKSTIPHNGYKTGEIVSIRQYYIDERALYYIKWVGEEGDWLSGYCHVEYIDCRFELYIEKMRDMKLSSLLV
jgi:hypothetical protein